MTDKDKKEYIENAQNSENFQELLRRAEEDANEKSEEELVN